MQGLKPLLHAPWVHDDARESATPGAAGSIGVFFALNGIDNGAGYDL